MTWKCFLCAGFSALYLALLLTHLNSAHREEDVDVQCAIGGTCFKTFTKVNTLIKHVRTSHVQYLYSTDGEGCLTALGQPTGQDHASVPQELSNFELSVGSCEDTRSGIENENVRHHQTVDIQDLTAKYLIKIKEGNRLTNKAMQNIVTSTSKLFHITFNQLKRKIECSLEEAGLELEDIPGISDAFDEVCDPFDQLLTTWMQSKYVQSHSQYVGPEKKILGKKRKIVKRNNKKKILEIEDIFYYIPILDTLQIQIRSPVCLDFILRGQEKSNDPEELRDFCDGTFISEHPLFGSDDQALQILMYYDDVNVVNPLNNKIHQLGFFYYQLANLPPQYRSKLKSIHLFSICKKEHIKKYGINKILQPFVEDLQSLGSDEGYPFQVDGGVIYIRGGLLAALADTPASQAAGGFKESVGGARRKCRHCMATFKQMQELFLEEKFVLRCKDEHERHIEKMENAPSKYLASYYSKYYGINTKAKLMEAPYFDVCQQLPQDLMHIFLEGILAYHIKHLLKYFISDSDGKITLDLINKEVKLFSLGYSHKQDRPVQIKDSDIDLKASTNLGQSASQMHLLAFILPFIMAKHVEIEDSIHWNCYMSLIEIIVMCFSSSITTQSVVYLKSAIKKYLQTFKDLYNARITPKMHYLVHLPSMILKFGPLIRSWCMRFEAKHSYFKDIARITKNFRNLPHTLSSRHQCMELADCLTLDDETDPCPLFSSDCDMGAIKPIKDHDSTAYAWQCIKNFYNIPAQYNIQNAEIFLIDSVRVYGTLYKPGANTFLLINKDFQNPEFGRLIKLWYVENLEVFFVLQKVETISYSEHVNAFEIEDSSLPQGYDIIAVNDLPSPRVHHAYKCNDKSYIIKRDE